MNITVYDCEKEEEVLFHQYGKAYQAKVTLLPHGVSLLNTKEAKGSTCVSVSHKRQITEEVLRGFQRAGVQYISTRSVGVNHIDMEAAERLGIVVENTPYSPDSVADHAIMMILMLLRQMKEVNFSTTAYDFSLPPKRSRELRDLTVGVVGTGQIGQTMIKRLKAFGCHILAYDKYQQPHLTDIKYTGYEELLRHSDIITYHAPLTEETHHMLNKENIKLLKDNSCIINTARGGLIDTEALLMALEEQKLAGAALDVVEQEEGCFYQNCTPEMVKPLLKRLCEMKQVILTPHMAFYTQHALEDTVKNSIQNCLAYERTKKQRKIV